MTGRLLLGACIGLALGGCSSITGAARVELSDPPVVTLEPGLRNWAVCVDRTGGRVALMVYRVSRTFAGTGIVLGGVAGATAGPAGAAAGAGIGGAIELAAALFGSGDDPVPSCHGVFAEPPVPPSAPSALDRAMDELRAESLPRGVQARAPAPTGNLAPGILVAAARAVDGDTIDAALLIPVPELGLEISAQRVVRLLGYDAPELRGKCANERAVAADAAGRLSELLATAHDLRLVDWDRAGDRYGRALARLQVDGRDVAETLVSEGLARPYDGRRRAPWCQAP